VQDKIPAVLLLTAGRESLADMRIISMKHQPPVGDRHNAFRRLAEPRAEPGVKDAPDYREIEPNQQELWTPSDIAPLLGITDRAVRYHCQHLFGHRARYRLNSQEAMRLYRFIRKFGLKSKNLSESFPTS
jgi:hypothetical protein